MPRKAVLLKIKNNLIQPQFLSLTSPYVRSSINVLIAENIFPHFFSVVTSFPRFFSHESKFPGILYL
jgi:hypothetical protein